LDGVVEKKGDEGVGEEEKTMGRRGIRKLKIG
jgi:hypothetical protein